MILSHVHAAELLFVAGQVPESSRDAARMIVREYRRDPDLTHAAAVVAQDFGDYPETASARMRACLRIVPGRIELPDSLTPDALALIGCETDDCTEPGPYLLVDKRLYCARCAPGAVLAETAGPDDETECDRG